LLKVLMLRLMHPKLLNMWTGQSQRTYVPTLLLLLLLLLLLPLAPLVAAAANGAAKRGAIQRITSAAGGGEEAATEAAREQHVKQAQEVAELKELVKRQKKAPLMPRAKSAGRAACRSEATLAQRISSAAFSSLEWAALHASV
jgi:hypothetical protein